jgi:hypothetical protein
VLFISLPRRASEGEAIVMDATSFFDSTEAEASKTDFSQKAASILVFGARNTERE